MRKDRELIAEGYRLGRSTAWLAREFGTTSTAIGQLVYRMGVHRSRDAGSKPGPKGFTKTITYRDQDIATRLAVLLGETPRGEAPRREIPDETLLRYTGQGIKAPEARTELEGLIVAHPKEDWDSDAVRRLEGLKLFAADALGGIELLPWQEACSYLMMSHPSTATICGRQSGKDFIIALLVLWESVTRPNSRTVLVSPAQRQSDELMERIFQFAARSPEVFDSFKSSNREKAVLRNGSIIYALPATGFIRGLTEITRAILNEVRDIPEEALDHVTPMLSRRAGSLHLFSTPMARVGPLFEAFHNPAFAAQQLPSTVNPYLPVAHLEREKLRMSADSYRREYLGEFSDAAGLFFASASIDAAREDYDMREAPEEGKYYAFGYDAARFRDASVLSVVSRDADGVHRLEWERSWIDMPFPEQLATIAYVHSIFHPVVFIAEAGPIALSPIEQLEQAGIRIERYVPTGPRKMEVYGVHKTLFEQHRIKIPTSNLKLITELKMFEFKTTDAGNVRLAGSEDDHADALAFACWGLAGGGGLSNIEPIFYKEPGMSKVVDREFFGGSTRW